MKFYYILEGERNRLFAMTMNQDFEAQQFVLNYLNTIGLKAWKNNEEFWSHLESHHQDCVLDQLDQAFIDHNNDNSSGEDIYTIKNQSLMLSLDVSNFSTDLYEKYFNWFMKHKPKAPNRILDIGCDNGIATCFYALLFPQSEVIGMDIGENAIKCANELAQKLHLTNVSFIQGDIHYIQDYFPNYSFDLITSLRSFHEIMEDFPDELPHASAMKYNPQDKRNLLHRIQVLLRDNNSEFVTCERLVGIHSITMWSHLLEHAGLFIKFPQSHFINFHEIGQIQQMPVLVASKQKLDRNIHGTIFALYHNRE